MDVFYVTVLVMISYLVPPYGWVQFTEPFESKEVCEAHLTEHWDSLETVLQSRFIGSEIKTLQCMTPDDAMSLNVELGHKHLENTIDREPKLK